MYYKLYIDSVFILQMTTDLYLLSLAGQIMRRTATRRRIWLGAAAGAGLSCVSLMIPVFTVGARLLLGSVPVSMCMMCLTYQIHGVRSLLRASLLMAAAGFFFGGGMIWILNRLRAVMKGGGGLFLTLAAGALSYLLLEVVLRRLMRRRADSLRAVRVYGPGLGQEIRGRGVGGTGDHLTEPLRWAPGGGISRKNGRCMGCWLSPGKC